MNLFSCDEHDDGVVVHFNIACPVCEVIKEFESVQLDLEYQDGELDEAQQEINDLKKEVKEFKAQLKEAK